MYSEDQNHQNRNLTPSGDTNLQLFTLSFPHDLERDYLEDYFLKSIGHIRISLLLAIFFYGVFGVLDAWLIPEAKRIFWLIRYGIFVPFTFSVFLFSFSRHFKKITQFLLSAVILTAGIGIVAMIALAPHSATSSYYAGLILVFIYGYTFLKLRFIWASLTGWAIVLAYELAAVCFTHTPSLILVSNNFFFLSGNIIGMFACYSIELSSRREFFQERQLQLEKKRVRAANRELEKRVQDRTSQLTDANRELKQEISERKRAEKIAQENEHKFRSLSENSPEIIYTLGYDGAFSYVNPAWEKILGYRIDEPIGKYFVDFAKPEDRRKYISFFKRIRDKNETLLNVTGTLLHKDGSERIFSLSGAPNLDSEKNVTGMVGLLKDITEQQRLQAQLQQAQKMEAIGTLAGGIAHDFNNLLQAVEGFTDLLILRNGKNQRGRHELLEIKKASQRASELTQQLLTFSRKVESKLRPVDLGHEVEQVFKLLKRTLPKMIEIELHLRDDLKTISADPAQMEQVMMNLAVNAADAMPDGGKLVIETKNVFLDESYCKIHLGTAPGNYVLLAVSDNGHGMDQETLKNVFEPFFTTKEVGKGTGLGMAMVYGIVKNHGGYITCYSEPGEGTTFNIYLPAIDQEIELEREEADELPTGGTETILLVDDEEFIRNLGTEVLPEFGYSVIATDTGEKALKIYSERREEVDLIILDLIMPGMGGKQCLEELLKMNPQARIVISSGYSANGRAKEAIEAGAKGFIRKPYDIKQMLTVVREALDN